MNSKLQRYVMPARVNCLVTERRMASSHTPDSDALTAKDIQKINPSGSSTET